VKGASLDRATHCRMIQTKGDPVHYILIGSAATLLPVESYCRHSCVSSDDSFAAIRHPSIKIEVVGVTS
jgi:hypothetical protein